MHFTSTDPFPSLRHFPTTERVQTRNISEQMCLEQICLGACQYFSIPLSHVHQGKQRCIVLLFYGRRNVLEAGSVSNLYCWRQEREWVRVREGVWRLIPQRAYFGGPDDSPARCDHTLSASSTSSSFLLSSQKDKFLKKNLLSLLSLCF